MTRLAVDIRAARERTFKGLTRWQGVQTPSTAASRRCFVPQSAIYDRSTPRADVVAALRSEPVWPSWDCGSLSVAASRLDCCRRTAAGRLRIAGRDLSKSMK